MTRLELEKLKVAKARGNLVDRSAIVSQVKTYCRIATERLLRIPDAAGPVLGLSAAGVGQLRRMIEEAVDELRGVK